MKHTLLHARRLAVAAALLGAFALPRVASAQSGLDAAVPPVTVRRERTAPVRSPVTVPTSVVSPAPAPWRLVLRSSVSPSIS